MHEQQLKSDIIGRVFWKVEKYITENDKKPTATSAFFWKSDFLLTIVDEQNSAIWREITVNFVFLPNEFLLGPTHKVRQQFLGGRGGWVKNWGKSDNG